MPSAYNWRTTDAEEIKRRRARAQTEEFQISNTTPSHPVFSNFRVKSHSGLTYSVEIRSVGKRFFACDCVDFRINGLGTCKHVEAVLLHLESRFKRLFRAAAEGASPRLDVVPDPAGESLQLLKGAGRVPAILREWFDEDGALCSGAPEEAVEALQQIEAKGVPNLRLSQELAPWLEARRRVRATQGTPARLRAQSAKRRMARARNQGAAVPLSARGNAAPRVHRARVAGG